MARRYSRDNRGRFASGGSGGSGGSKGGGKVGATARGGRLRTAAGNKRTDRALEGKARTVKAAGAKAAGTVGKPRGLKPGAIKLKSAVTTRKGQLAAGAQRRNAQADRIDAKVKKLEGEYRSKDAAFYTQGVKPAGRDRMIAKSQQAAQLREQSAALRSKAANAEKMSQRVKGTAASKKQERRNAFDTAGYKVGDTVTTRQNGTQKITKISKNSVSFDKGNTEDKAFMASYLGLQGKPPAAAKPASSKGARLGGSRRTTAASAPKNTTTNKTGQSKTLNRFNSRPERTRGAYVGGRYVDKAKLTGRQALDFRRSDDQAFARTATKAARQRAAAPVKAAARQTVAQRATRAVGNQKRVVASIQAKGGRRPTPSRKQRRSLMTSEAAKRFYATKAVDYLKVNVKKPGFRLPRGMR